MFEPNTKSIVHKHTLSAQRRLIINNRHRAYCNGVGSS